MSLVALVLSYRTMGMKRMIKYLMLELKILSCKTAGMKRLSSLIALVFVS
jgi:hypothetical protein